MSVQSYRDLAAWQKAMDLVEAVYRATQRWPREEVYGLTNQARPAAVSVPANIAAIAQRSAVAARLRCSAIYPLRTVRGTSWRPICSSRSACATWMAQPRRSCSRRQQRSDASWVASCAACANQATDDRRQTLDPSQHAVRSATARPLSPVACRLPPVAASAGGAGSPAPGRAWRRARAACPWRRAGRPGSCRRRARNQQGQRKSALQIRARR